MKKLTTTHRIQENAILRVYKKGFGYSKLKVLYNTKDFIATRSNTEFLNNVNDGDTIDVYLWVEDVASYDFSVTVIGRITIDNKIIFLNHSENITRREKRRCLTANVNIPITFFLLNITDTSKNISMEEVNHLEATMTELGDREATIQSTDSLPIDTFLKGHITINGQDIEIVGQLTDISTNEYTITFTGMNDEDRNSILDYIFTTYRE